MHFHFYLTATRKKTTTYTFLQANHDLMCSHFPVAFNLHKIYVLLIIKKHELHLCLSVNTHELNMQYALMYGVVCLFELLICHHSAAGLISGAQWMYSKC